MSPAKEAQVQVLSASLSPTSTHHYSIMSLFEWGKTFIVFLILGVLATS